MNQFTIGFIISFCITSALGWAIRSLWERELDELTDWLELIGIAGRTGCLEILFDVQRDLGARKFMFHREKKQDTLEFCDNLISLTEKLNQEESKDA